MQRFYLPCDTSTEGERLLARRVDPAPQTNQSDQKREAARFHQIEQWRDDLINNIATAMNELISQFPQLDRQHLNQLIRNAQNEISRQQPPKSSRKLFRYLQSLDNKE